MVKQHISKIRQASRQIIRELGVLNNQFSEVGSVTQCHALLELERHKMLTANQLSKLLHVEKSSISRMLKELLNKDYCIQQTDPHDNRHKLISLTENGKQAIAKLNQLADKQVSRALVKLSPEEQALVTKSMLLYAKALQQTRVSDQIQIRALDKTDIPKLTRIIRLVWSEFGFDVDHPDAKIFEEELKTLFDYYQSSSANYFVLLVDDSIVGGGGYGPCPCIDKTSICELKNMYFLPEVRGMGLGSRLLEFILEKAKQDNYKQCYLETMYFMSKANALYQKFSFKKLDKPLIDTRHTWTTNWYMKELTEGVKS